MKRRHLLLSLSALAACSDSATNAAKPAFSNIDITGADYAKELPLPDVDGKTRTLSEFQGKVVIVFFGFAQCPDVCPTTMAEIAEVRQKLGAAGAKVQPIFITVDPERDTPQAIKDYLANFHPRFAGLTGSPAQIAKAAKAYHVYYAKIENKTDPQSYLMDHSSIIYLMGPDGRFLKHFAYTTDASALAAGLKTALSGG